MGGDFLDSSKSMGLCNFLGMNTLSMRRTMMLGVTMFGFALAQSVFADDAANKAALKTSFVEADLDGDGIVSHEEFAAYVVTQKLANHDTTGDKLISRDEAAAAKVAIEAKMEAGTVSQDRVIDLDFKKADTDGDGLLSHSEILTNLKKKGITTVFSGIAPEDQNNGFAPDDWEEMHTSGGIPLLSISF